MTKATVTKATATKATATAGEETKHYSTSSKFHAIYVIKNSENDWTNLHGNTSVYAIMSYPQKFPLIKGLNLSSSFSKKYIRLKGLNTEKFGE